VVQFASLDELPPAASTDRETFRRLGVKSVIALPLRVGGQHMGVLAFGAFRTERPWPASLVRRLVLVAEVFASALARRAADEALRSAFKTVEALKEKLEAENVLLRQDLRLLNGHPRILGRSAPLRRVLAQAEQVAPTDATVLLLGETGTGKELIASAIPVSHTACCVLAVLSRIGSNQLWQRASVLGSNLVRSLPASHTTSVKASLWPKGPPGSCAAGNPEQHQRRTYPEAGYCGVIPR